MGFLSRLKHIVEADLYEALEQKEQKNPMAMLNYYLRQCEKEVDKAKVLVERHETLVREYEKEWQEAMKMANKRKQQASIAQQAGAKDLYDYAVKEQGVYSERAERLKELKVQTQDELEALVQKYEKMNHKLKDMHVKKLELMGRENSARANYRMNQVLEGDTYTNKTFTRFEEMEKYLTELEHKVNARHMESTFDIKIKELEGKLYEKEAIQTNQ
ncbi:PspA/IM30 family protein [Bacillus kexueae]|uniref:PspA/IM30 family protein n=1 Tax=Aeribacillus kexueae TaxID=2078952 RepID=UPI001FAEA925|nr:PspA/IM30 family protein [Bacillus kexueae]